MRFVVAALLVASSTLAHAGEVTLPRTKAKLVVPDDWSRVTADGVVAGFKAPSGTLLAVTRAPVPNPDAWRTKKRDAYGDQIERGVAAALPGYRKVSRKLGQTNGVPTLDLEARRADGATIVIRTLLFRTYALSVALELPKGSSRGDATTAKAIVASFAPSIRYTSDTP